MRPVRVRFAPSPTGALHIGGVRTALYNFLLARKHGGTMILRIEDTDQARYVPGAEEYIIESLRWAGIQIDEGVGAGGTFAPYRQSERKQIYQQCVRQLIEDGHAYYAFDSEAELEAMRERLKNAGENQQHYNSATRMSMKNSLSLPAVEVQTRLLSEDPYVVRLKVEPGIDIHLHDLIRGEVVVNSSQIDDKVLMKSDGMPTYHLANVVDDYMMKISHVIRGEEWLPSAPLHVLLYRYFGWEKEMPAFAHLPLLLKPDGNGKLSKRDADRMGFPIFPINWKDPASGELVKGYRESGYLPEALINFLALLGWNPGTTQELFTIDELIQSFTLERINKAGARFDIQKAQWFNQQYLRALPDERLRSFLQESLTQHGLSADTQTTTKVVRVMRDRVTFPQDFWEQGRFFFLAPDQYDDQIVSKKWNEESVRGLKEISRALKATGPVAMDEIKATVDKALSGLGIKPGAVLPVLRLCMTGGSAGPDLMTTIEILGAAEAGSRIDRAIERLSIKTH
ncbi:MAG: glutamate--tRNA ligase [Bacteroidetes bacterium]|nr:glutamate--tRNA ligase [Bacteroidota bacterium]